MEGAPTNAQHIDPQTEREILRERSLVAIEEFNGETMLYKNLSSDPKLFETVASIPGGALDPEGMEHRSKLYQNILDTLHYNAGHAVAVGKNLEGEKISEAENFLNEEIAKLIRMRDALRV